MREPAAAHRSVTPGAAGANAPATTNPTIVSTQTALMWQIADGARSRRSRMRSIARWRRTPHQRAARSGVARATAPCESVCGSVPRSRRFSRRSRSQRRPGVRSLEGEWDVPVQERIASLARCDLNGFRSERAGWRRRSVGLGTRKSEWVTDDPGALEQRVVGQYDVGGCRSLTRHDSPSLRFSREARKSQHSIAIDPDGPLAWHLPRVSTGSTMRRYPAT